MRKTLALIAALSFLAACGDRASQPANAPSVYVESAAPSEVVPTATAQSFRADVSGIRAVHADPKAYPEHNGVYFTLTLTNHGSVAASYKLDFSVNDATGAVVGTVGIDTSMNYQPLQPGGVLHLARTYLSENTVPEKFSVTLESVDRVNTDG